MRRLTMVVIVAMLAVGLSACGKHGAKNVYACPNKGPGVGFSATKSGKLTVQTSLPAAEWWTGKTVDTLTGGFEFNLAKDLCAQLGIGRVRIVSVSRTALAAGKTNNFDLGLAQVVVTPTLSTHVAVSTPYLTVGGTQYAAVLPKGSANTKLVNTAISKLVSNGTIAKLTTSSFTNGTPPTTTAP